MNMNLNHMLYFVQNKYFNIKKLYRVELVVGLGPARSITVSHIQIEYGSSVRILLRVNHLLYCVQNEYFIIEKEGVWNCWQASALNNEQSTL